MLIVVGALIVLSLLIVAHFILGDGETAPCKTEENFKEKWEEEYSLVYEYDDSKID